MFSFKGANTTLAISSSLNLPTVVENFSLVNKQATDIIANVYLLSGTYSICMIPLNQQIATGEMFYAEHPIVILATEQIKIQTSGGVDYIFNMNNADVPNI